MRTSFLQHRSSGCDGDHHGLAGGKRHAQISVREEHRDGSRMGVHLSLFVRAVVDAEHAYFSAFIQDGIVGAVSRDRVRNLTRIGLLPSKNRGNRKNQDDNRGFGDRGNGHHAPGK